MDYDLIIVGSGSIGAAAGYYATQAGLRVLMIDSAHPPHQQGSHHGETRLIRHAYGEGEKYVSLALRSQTLWDELQQLSEKRLFTQTGVLNIGPADSVFLSNVAHSASQWQIPLEKINARELMARWPQIRVPEYFIGMFEPNGGVLNSEDAVALFIRLACEAGCAQLFNCPATAIRQTENGIEVDTAEGCWRGAKLLLSAGTWAGKLLPSLPITPIRKVFAWHQADGLFSTENHFPAFTAELENGDSFYGFPSQNNALKIGKHSGGQPISSPEQRATFGTTVSDGSEAFTFLRQILPGTGVCLHGEACSYDNSPDGDFIIDTLPQAPDALVITGLSGHGFKFAPALGEIACRFAQGHSITPALASFRLSRFKQA